MRNLSKRHFVLILVILPCFTPFLPIKVPYTFEGQGRLYPQQEWVVSKDADGGLMSTLYHHQRGLITEVNSYKIERGDISNIQIAPFQSQERFVRAGDTIANIRSYLLEERIFLLKQQLNVEKARLRSDGTGSKGPIIAEARTRLEFAQEQYNLAKINYERDKELFEKEVIPEASFRTVENNFRLAEIQIKIDRNALRAAEMGKKPEELQFILANLNAIEQELEFLETKRAGYYIISPISGVVDYAMSEEQVLTVNDDYQLIVTVPIKLKDQSHIRVGTNIEIRAPGLTQKVKAKVIGINDKVELLQGNQVLFVKAAIAEVPKGLRKGMMVECKFLCDTINLWEYVDRMVGQWKK